MSSSPLIESLYNSLHSVKDAFGYMSRRPKEVTSITTEYGLIKVLVSRGFEILDYQIVPVNPKFFREGIVADTTHMGDILRNTLQKMKGHHKFIIGAVPGYSSATEKLYFPMARGFNPSIVIPNELRRRMGVSPETSYVTWYRLEDRFDGTQWLAITGLKREINSLVDTVNKAGLKMAAMEPRSFTLARAVNKSDAIIGWTSVEGADITIVKDSVPVLTRSSFFGYENVEPNVAVNRLTTLIETACTDYEKSTTDILSDSTPLYICGHYSRLESGIGQQIAEQLGYDTEEPTLPIDIPTDFPLNDLIVNIGLALREVG